MASEPKLIIQVARESSVHRQFRAHAPDSVVSGEILVEVEPADPEGHLEPPAAGEVVLSVPSPEALLREAEEVRRVVGRAGTGTEPLVVIVEAALELRDDELAAVLDPAGRAPRPVILRVMRDG
jgi:hypothetical protein